MQRRVNSKSFALIVLQLYHMVIPRTVLHRVMGSNTSINTLGEGKGEGKTLDFLKKQTQRPKGIPGAQG